MRACPTTHRVDRRVEQARTHSSPSATQVNKSDPKLSAHELAKKKTEDALKKKVGCYPFAHSDGGDSILPSHDAHPIGSRFIASCARARNSFSCSGSDAMQDGKSFRPPCWFDGCVDVHSRHITYGCVSCPPHARARFSSLCMRPSLVGTCSSTTSY